MRFITSTERTSLWKTPDDEKGAYVNSLAVTSHFVITGTRNISVLYLRNGTLLILYTLLRDNQRASIARAAVVIAVILRGAFARPSFKNKKKRKKIFYIPSIPFPRIARASAARTPTADGPAGHGAVRDSNAPLAERRNPRRFRPPARPPGNGKFANTAGGLLFPGPSVRENGFISQLISHLQCCNCRL